MTRAAFKSPTGKEILVEDGCVFIGDVLVHEGVQAGDVCELNFAPKAIQRTAKQYEIDFATHVWVQGSPSVLILEREVAAEAIRQYAPIALAKKEREGAKKALKVNFYVCGRDGVNRLVSVNMLENPEEQFEKIAACYKQDGISADIVLEAYLKRLIEMRKQKAEELAEK